MTYTRRRNKLVRLRSRHKLETLMRTRDLNGAELAGAADVSRQTISNLRAGKTASTDVSVASAIADALRIDADKLFDMSTVEQEVEAS